MLPSGSRSCCNLHGERDCRSPSGVIVGDEVGDEGETFNRVVDLCVVFVDAPEVSVLHAIEVRRQFVGGGEVSRISRLFNLFRDVGGQINPRIDDLIESTASVDDEVEILSEFRRRLRFLDTETAGAMVRARF